MRRLYLCCALAVALLFSGSRQFFGTPVGQHAPASALVLQPMAASSAPATPRLAWAAPSMRRSGEPVAVLPSLSPDVAASNLAAIAGVVAVMAAVLRSTTFRQSRTAPNAARVNLRPRGEVQRRSVVDEAPRLGSAFRHSAAELPKPPAATPPEASMQAKPPQALQAMAEFLDKRDLKNLDVALGKKLGLAMLAVPAPAFANERDGWLGWTVDATEFSIRGLHDLLGPGSYGYAIILFTLFIKAVTFPLNYQQIESSTKMQALSPKVKMVQEKYRNDPATMNQKLGELYMGANVNPIAALLPTFVQLPILISLYKGLNYLTEADALEEPFLFLPNLEGPTFGNRGMDWILKFSDWHDGAPPLGWDNTLRFLALPVILVGTQKLSLELNKPAEGPKDPQQEQTYKILGYLPFILGLTALSVPSGLSIYWIVNNVVTTGTTLAIKERVKAEIEEKELVSTGTSSPSKAAEPDFSRGFGQTAKVVSQTRTESGTVTIRPPGAADQPQVLETTAVSSAVLEPVEAEVVSVAPKEVSKTQAKKRAKAVKKKKKGR